MLNEYHNELAEKSGDTGYCSDIDTDRISPLKYRRLEDDIYIEDTSIDHDLWCTLKLRVDVDLLDNSLFTGSTDTSALKCTDIKSCKSCDIEKRDIQDDSQDTDNSPNIKLDGLHIEESAENESANLWNVVVQKDSDGDNLLFVSIILLNTHISCMLIDLAPSYQALNDVNKLFQTALHLAALTGNYTVTRRLLVSGAITDKRDFQLNTALHVAVRKDYIKVARHLMTPVTYIEAKRNSYEIPYQKIPQNLELMNAAGRTCLHIAARRKNRHMIDLLLSNEADINARDLKSGKTILHYFAEDDDVDMVKYIVSKPKLNLNVNTYNGVTAAEMAYAKGHFAIAYLLLSSGASDVIASFHCGDADSGSDSEDSDTTF